jgi:hypothetical protein
MIKKFRAKAEPYLRCGLSSLVDSHNTKIQPSPDRDIAWHPRRKSSYDFAENSPFEAD